VLGNVGLIDMCAMHWTSFKLSTMWKWGDGREGGGIQNPKNSINIGGIQNPKNSINIILEMYNLEAIRERERERERVLVQVCTCNDTIWMGGFVLKWDNLEEGTKIMILLRRRRHTSSCPFSQKSKEMHIKSMAKKISTGNFEGEGDGCCCIVGFRV
jgi:hypothetical protein